MWRIKMWIMAAEDWPDKESKITWQKFKSSQKKRAYDNLCNLLDELKLPYHKCDYSYQVTVSEDFICWPHKKNIRFVGKPKVYSFSSHVKMHEWIVQWHKRETGDNILKD